MSYDPPDSVGEALYPRGFRKTLAMILFFLVTTLPTVILWENTPVSQTPLPGSAGARGFGGSGFGPHDRFGGSPGGRFQPSSFGGRFNSAPQASRNWSWSNILPPFAQVFLATVGGAFSLALYYPRSGFKRFAILCGPMLGFGSMSALALYLAARSEVYRFEICFVAIAGALPGLLVYLALVYWKTNRLQVDRLPMQLDEHVPLEIVEQGPAASPYKFPHR